MKRWDGKDLKGNWVITIKIDGINATWSKLGGFVSRRGKLLYNADKAGEAVGAVEGEIYEIFCGSFKETISIVRSSKSEKRPVTECELFNLEPEIDGRLYCDTIENPTAEDIKNYFDEAIWWGHEGLVLRGPNGERLKVKNKITLDLIVTGMTEGKGRNAGRCGALITSRGKVSGMSDDEREEFWNWPGGMEGVLIEVECMELTESGKMRHGRFVRIRDDKPMEESDD